MTDGIAIRVKALGKKYRISGPSEHYRTLRDAIAGTARAPFHLFRPAPAGEEFWALRDISFDIERGAAVGIIGRNGAGKSTLLKILSRITSPTEGEAEIHGRVGSLLEVGTGFHPEMTGRENVFLNGSILGMKKAEIEQQFDGIVRFAEVEKFIDMPVKRYSSGMYVRLAFAVAAHLEPEILLVDEVLAVGDAAFQKKCVGKMGEVTREGRTVLFVSHNMSAVMSLCEQSLLLDGGRVRQFSDTPAAVQAYLSTIQPENSGFVTFAPGTVPTDRNGIIRAVGIRKSQDGKRYTPVISTGGTLVVEIHCARPAAPVDFAAVGIDTQFGQRVLTAVTNQDPSFDRTVFGDAVISCRIPNLMLAKGDYTITVMLGNRTSGFHHLAAYIERAVSFHVELSDFFRTGAEYLPFQGVVVQPSTWSVDAAGEVQNIR